MTRTLFVRRLLCGAAFVASAALAAPGFAQGPAGTSGTLKGRVLEADGKPSAGANVMLEDLKDASKGPFLIQTNLEGLFSMELPAGTWQVTVHRDKFTAQRKEPAVIAGGDKVDAGDLKMHAGTATEINNVAAAEKALIAKHNEKAAKETAAIQAADAARDAGNFDDAIQKYTDVAGLIENCGVCYIRIGDIYLEKKNDPAGAEKAFQKAIELNDAGAADANVKAIPYEKLAEIYNKQQKFDDAAKMSAKANEIQEAGGGAGDPTAAYNQGVSLWNAGKAADALPQFQKAVKLDPKMAEAYYYLAMCQVSANKLTDAKPNLETYLKLAPDGPNAATAKAVLDSIK